MLWGCKVKCPKLRKVLKKSLGFPTVLFKKSKYYTWIGHSEHLCILCINNIQCKINSEHAWVIFPEGVILKQSKNTKNRLIYVWSVLDSYFCNSQTKIFYILAIWTLIKGYKIYWPIFKYHGCHTSHYKSCTGVHQTTSGGNEADESRDLWWKI